MTKQFWAHPLRSDVTMNIVNVLPAYFFTRSIERTLSLTSQAVELYVFNYAHSV